MKNNSWEDELLDEILGETAPPGFRAGSLDQMLGAVRQRRRSRRRGVHALLIAFCLTSLGVFITLVPKQNLTSLIRSESLLVHSQPVPSGMIVITDPLLISTVDPSTSPVALVEDLPPRELFETIGDDTLLTLLSGRPAALVHPANGPAELVFVNPADARGEQIPSN